jgi:hypothetical protein
VAFPPIQTAMCLDGVSQKFDHLVLPTLTPAV